MYESFFQFHRRPFPSTPQPELYFPAASTENAFHTLARLVERAEGPGLLIGGPGTGKSLVCQMLQNRFSETFHVVMLNSAQLTTHRALLQHVLFELQLAYRGLDEGELLLALMEFLQPGNSSKAGLLLLVDEAHTLPPSVLEGLRTITNVTRNGQPRVRLILAGGPQLEERFADPQLDCFNQRLAARCYLQPLNYDETCAYVHSQLAQAGAPPDRVIGRDAWQPIYHATDGIPRLINQVCDHALMLACAAERHQLDSQMIDNAWADLQQLPTPWQPASATGPEAVSVVEFGGLAVDEDEPEPVRKPEIADESADESFNEFEASFDLIDRVEPANPFDERFEHEEVVVDRYASLQAIQGGNSPAVMQQREIAAAMQTIFQNAVQYVEPPEEPEPASPEPEPESLPSSQDVEEEILQTLNELGQQASHALQSPATDETADETVDESCILLGLENESDEEGSIQVIRTLPPDDNDMIVVVDEQRGETPLRSSGGISHRQEYRQLFSRLRRT